MNQVGATIGLKASKLTPGNRGEWQKFEETLYLLGAIDADDELTEIGTAMSRLPVDVDVRYARMIVEAQKRGVLPEILIIISCLMVGGILGWGKKAGGNRELPRWRLSHIEQDSDLLAQLYWFVTGGVRDRDYRSGLDIMESRFNQARAHRDELAKQLGTPTAVAKMLEKDVREQVLKVILAGMADFLLVCKADEIEFDKTFYGLRGRALDDKTTVNVFTSRICALVGLPLDLDIAGSYGQHQLRLLTFLTKVSVPLVLEAVPQAITLEPRGMEYSREHGQVMEVVNAMLHGTDVDTSYRSVEASPEATRVLAQAIMRGYVTHASQDRDLRVIGNAMWIGWRNNNPPELSEHAICERIAAKLGGAYRASDLDNFNLELADLIPEKWVDEAKSVDPIEAAGFTYILTPGRLGVMYADVTVDIEQLHSLANPPELQYCRVRTITVMDDDQLLRNMRSMDEVRSELRRMEKARHRAAASQEIATLQADFDYLELEGKPTDRLGRLLLQATKEADNELFASAQDTIHSAREEIERLSGDPTDLLLDELMQGNLLHRDHQRNLAVKEYLRQLRIRTNGATDVMTDQQLRDFYRGKLEGITRVDEALGANLALSAAGFLGIEEDLEEFLAGPDVAPATVTIAFSRKNKAPKKREVPVHYSRAGGKPIAIVDFEGRFDFRLADYRDQLPELPHGIRFIDRSAL